MGLILPVKGYPKLDSAKEGKASYAVRAIGYDMNAIAQAFFDSQAYVPDVIFGLQKSDFSMEPYEETEEEDQCWTVLFQYNREGWSQETQSAFGESPVAEFEFDAAFENQRITTALEQTKTGAFGPDFGLNINVNSDFEVEGTEIPVPVLAFNETHYFSPSALNSAYLDALFENIGKTNANEFRGRAPGEVQYLGTRFKTKGREAIGLDMKFRASKNRQNIDIGNGLIVPQKNAWEYLWKWCVRKKDATNPTLATEVRAGYVAKVVESIDFSFLGINQGEFSFGT